MKKAAATCPAAARSRFVSLVQNGTFKACERHVLNAYDAEDRIAEGLGMTWIWYQKQAALGRTPDLPLIRHCCNLRTVDRSHRLVSGDRTRWRQDVYNAQGSKGVELRRLQLVADVDDRVEEDPSLGLAEAGCQDPTDKMDSALDLEGWLAQLTARDRTMLAMRLAGYGLVEIGCRLNLTTSTVWGRTQRLGAELAQRTGWAITPQRQHRRSGAGW
jgi:hypothetical protein